MITTDEFLQDVMITCTNWNLPRHSFLSTLNIRPWTILPTHFQSSFVTVWTEEPHITLSISQSSTYRHTRKLHIKVTSEFTCGLFCFSFLSSFSALARLSCLPVSKTAADKHTFHVKKFFKLDGQGRARRKAARRRKSEWKVNVAIPNSSRSNGSWQVTPNTVSLSIVEPRGIWTCVSLQRTSTSGWSTL